MPRQTLPDFDPLSTLGIVSTERDEHTPRPARRPTARQLTRATRDAAPAAQGEPQPVVPAANEFTTIEPPAATTQEATVSRPERAVEPTRPQSRGQANLSLAASTTAVPRVVKAKTSGRIAPELWEEVRDCVVWHGHKMTIDSFTEEAFREHLARLRRRNSLGDRFPVRERDPKQGRRVS